MLHCIDYSAIKNNSYGVQKSKIYKGDIYCCKNFPQTLAITEYIKNTLGTECLQPHMLSPHMHKNLSVNQFEIIKKYLHAKIQKNNYIHTMLISLFQHFGWNHKDMLFDTLALRMNPPKKYRMDNEDFSASRSYTNIHRDTWGVAIMSQINFWMPIFPLSIHNTFALYLSHWNKALANSSDTWSFSEYIQHKHQGYPIMPQPLEKPDNTLVHKVMIAPSDMLIFSAAHLHGTITNTSNNTRINFETRCYFPCDEKHAIGAPNVDTFTKKKALFLFNPL